jgi:hypothetical protein
MKTEPLICSAVTSVYKRRGLPHESVKLFDKETQYDLGSLAVDRSERAALLIQDPKDNRSIVVTTHAILQRNDGRVTRIDFKDISDSRPNGFGVQPLNLANTLVVSTKSGGKFEISLPTAEVLSGVWSIIVFAMRHYARYEPCTSSKPGSV